MGLFTKFIELMIALEKNGADYMLVGEMAINLHGYNRNTGDIDIFIRPTFENLHKVKTALYEVIKDDSIDEITFDDLNRYVVIRTGSPNNFYIDIIGRIGDAYKYEELSYVFFELDGIKIKVADADSLIKLKSKTYREIDKADIIFLQFKSNK